MTTSAMAVDTTPTSEQEEVACECKQRGCAHLFTVPEDLFLTCIVRDWVIIADTPDHDDPPNLVRIGASLTLPGFKIFAPEGSDVDEQTELLRAVLNQD